MGAVVSELVDALPQLVDCKPTLVSLADAGSHAIQAVAILGVARGSTAESSAEDLVAQARLAIEAAREVGLLAVRIQFIGVLFGGRLCLDSGPW